MIEQVREGDTKIAAQDSAAGVRTGTSHLVGIDGKTSGQAIGQWLDAEREAGPFQDLSLSLYLFTRRLYEAALNDGVEDLFFFAREGYLLKQMFDVVTASEDGAPIRSHYLKVSRRSTFLLSLRPLGQEKFEVLFRQYRRISIVEFLKSLALEEHMSVFAAELGVSPTLFAERSGDLPHDRLFMRLLKVPSFVRTYEAERLARSKAFQTYVSGFLNGVLPDRLHVVDVGWKGSIQDNVFSWLRNVRGDGARVKGYYVGLVATGNSSPANEKTGLLFSSIGKRTAGYYVFNENRSLFEVLLHANHGSAQRYVKAATGEIVVVEDDFEEGPMIAAVVKPAADRIMTTIGRIAAVVPAANLSRRELLMLAVERHARMVFEPSISEIEWMRSLSHVENFGVFEASRFDGRRASGSFGARLRFAIDLFRRHRRDLGFWPWLTIEERAFWGMAQAYRAIRMLQTRRTLRSRL